MSQQKEGKVIIPIGIIPEKHELETAAVFLRLGLDVEFIKPSGTRKSRSPDVIICGIAWEIKSPTGNGKYTVQKQFSRAARQSRNLIFDARRTKLSSKFIEAEVARQFVLRKSIVRVKLITKTGAIVDIF